GDVAKNVQRAEVGLQQSVEDIVEHQCMSSRVEAAAPTRGLRSPKAFANCSRCTPREPFSSTRSPASRNPGRNSAASCAVEKKRSCAGEWPAEAAPRRTSRASPCTAKIQSTVPKDAA